MLMSVALWWLEVCIIKYSYGKKVSSKLVQFFVMIIIFSDNLIFAPLSLQQNYANSIQFLKSFGPARFQHFYTPQCQLQII